MDGIKAEREPTNLSPGVRASVTSHIPITKGLVDFPIVGGEDNSGSAGHTSGE